MTLKDEQLEAYAASRRTQRGAESYATKYDRELHKRISSFFERRAIRRALARTGAKHARVLDVPCGAGRLTPELTSSAELLVSADYSPSMLGVFARRHGRPCFVGNALRLPFADRTFDLVFSARLSHHMSERQRREDYLREVLRASDRWAVVTIFDSASLKSRLRNLRSKRPKNTLSRAEVTAVAESAGFAVRAAYPLSRLASGHLFYVFERTG